MWEFLHSSGVTDWVRANNSVHGHIFLRARRQVLRPRFEPLIISEYRDLGATTLPPAYLPAMTSLAVSLR